MVPQDGSAARSAVGLRSEWLSNISRAVLLFLPLLVGFFRCRWISGNQVELWDRLEWTMPHCRSYFRLVRAGLGVDDLTVQQKARLSRDLRYLGEG